MQPQSLCDAMELCIEFAREKNNASVDRVADGMGLTNKWTLYKWMESGGLPVRMIRPFEMACGIDLVSRWLATSAGRLVVDMPTGRRAASADINDLQELLNTAVGQLIKFYAGKSPAADTLGAIQSAMEGLAHHHGQVRKHEQPELDFGMED